jgi:hypothetical protein
MGHVTEEVSRCETQVLANYPTSWRGVKSHTIADDFVARLALDVAVMSVSPTHTRTSSIVEYTMQILLHMRPSQVPDRTILWYKPSALVHFTKWA